MNKKAYIDTNILIWYLAPNSNADTNLIDSSKELIKTLINNNFQIIIPTIVVSELLLQVTKKEYGDIVTYISTNFMIEDFCLLGAMKLAQLWHEREKEGTIKKLKDIRDPNDKVVYTHARLRADSQILAVAIANNGNRLYTHNTKDFIKLSGSYIEIYNLTGQKLN